MHIAVSAFCSYSGFGISAIMAVLTIYGSDHNSLQSWARKEALKELLDEDDKFAAYAADEQLQKEMAAKFRAMGKHPDR